MKQILREEDLPLTGEFRPSAVLGAISRAKNEMLDPTFLVENARRTTASARSPGSRRATRSACARPARSTSTTSCSRPSACSTRRPTSSPSTRSAGATSTSTSTRTRTAPSTCGSGRSPRSTATSRSSATTTSRSTRGAAPTCATSSTSSATGPKATVVKLEQNYRSTQLILDAAHAVVSRNTARKDKKLWTENAGGIQIQRFEAYNEDEEAEWIARQVEGLSAAAGRALTRRADEDDAGHPVPRPRHRGHVPDERPVPGDRGIVPALRDPLPARRRDAVLRTARGQGCAGVPADPALGHGQRQLRADHQRPGARIGDKTIEVARAPRRADPRPASRHVWSAIERGGAGELPASRRAPRTALAEFAALVRRLRTRIGVLPLPELLDEVLEASGYRAMLADGSEDGEERWANLLELRVGDDPLRRPRPPRTRSTGCSRRPRSSPTRTRTRATPTP